MAGYAWRGRHEVGPPVVPVQGAQKALLPFQRKMWRPVVQSPPDFPEHLVVEHYAPFVGSSEPNVQVFGIRHVFRVEDQATVFNDDATDGGGFLARLPNPPQLDKACKTYRRDHPANRRNNQALSHTSSVSIR